ncbi:helix-turn-helix domain-containing protein [Calidifontibacillus erzurumensis]|uniref:helix-turn-helix domain-containing protein n=1 Tax=Calidifontibacillus erzurumensis TaxID=2741433 RepID=UPI0035B53D11
MIKIQLQELLDKKGISQRTLAKETNIRQETINRMCNNNSVYLRIDHLDKICDFLNCSLDEIIIYKKVDKNSKK